MNAVAVTDTETMAEYEDLFPAKLHYVLEQVESAREKSGEGTVITWQPHGRAFMVNDRAKFVEAYLPNWFRQTTWASFQRQLNHYEFKRISSGPDKNSYYHPCFVRGDRSLCKYIRRVTLKGEGPRKPSKPEDQPNFYQLQPYPVSGPPRPDAIDATPPSCVSRPLPAIRRVSSATQCSLPRAPTLSPTMQASLQGTTLVTWSGLGRRLEPPNLVGMAETAPLLYVVPGPRPEQSLVDGPMEPPRSASLLFMAGSASTDARRGGQPLRSHVLPTVSW